MLQQTQVERVIPYYERFVKKFPNPQKLSKAKLSDVLRLWSGLGYNRRAKYLQDAAKTVVAHHGGKFPKQYEELRKLPGVGDYTARAVRVFAFNEPDVLIETNIRTVFIHYFFKDASDIHDKELAPLAHKAAKGEDPREWHWALMDFGSSLKRSGVRNNRKSAHFTKQSRFEGSFRQLRGRILLQLMQEPKSLSKMKKIDAKNASLILLALRAMQKENLVVKEGDLWMIA
jgi:A/G-specific adenine glycosylase